MVEANFSFFTFHFSLFLCIFAVRMKKLLLIITSLLMTITISADDAQNVESRRRIDHLCELYNNDLNDSLIQQVPLDLAFHKENQCWEHYYETWMHLVNTYTFMGKVNTALQEVKQMHADATQRNDRYGLALANYAMGNAYLNMGYLDESINCYQQSLQLISESNVEPSTLNDIYSYYCDALNDQKRWESMRDVTEEWRAFLDNLAQEELKKKAGKNNSDVWYAYYYLACAQQHLGMNMLAEAKADIDEAEKRQDLGRVFISLSVLYYRAQYYLQAKDYPRAYEYNTRRLEESQHVDDMSSKLLIYQQRAEIMKGLGRYNEAAEMYRQTYHLSDSIYKKDARTQINELNTLFHVSELDMEHRLQQGRIISITIAIVAVALAILLGYGLWMNRRLRRKNEELAEARDQAQEALRMKSDFIKNISHEIRTPLNILSGFSQIMSERGDRLPDKDRQELSNGIQENTNRITKLINRLLELSDSHSRSHIERTDTISANLMCQMAIASSGVADDKRHQFHFDTTLTDDFTIVTSEHYAVHAIDHLLDNAMKFTPEGGSITMRCSQQGNTLEVIIEDTGCGVPQEKADTIFEEFVQLDEFQTGVGIGLSLSRSIVRRLGGDITLDTSYHSGARFVLTLPIIEGTSVAK